MKPRISVRCLCLTALGIGINLVCAFISMSLKIPLYMDSIGTIFIAALLGPRYGMAAGLLGSILSGITFDIYSLYYAPVQILTACTAAAVMHSRWSSGGRMLLGGVMVSLPTSLASAMITAFVFGGQTAAVTSYVIVLLHELGMSLTLSCFLVQILTEYLDKLAAMVLVKTALNKGVYRIYGTIQPHHQ